jgi:hypothetical protein
LDVIYFKPFLKKLKKYRDVWGLANNHKPTEKEDLAQWVSLALK